MNITYIENPEINVEEIKELYNDVNWTVYTKDINQLEKLFKNSSYVLTAYNNNKLVGILRAITDDVSIIYIQDILVLENYQHQGIGTNLLKQTIERYNYVRQKVLMTDDTKKTRGFYTKCGFHACDDGQLISFIKFN